LVEIIFGFFGILGMGWLYAGNFLTSIILFVGFAIIVFIEAAFLVASFGLLGCLIVPINLVIAIISGFRVRDYVRNSGVSGSFVRLILGLVIGVVIVCGGLTILGVFSSILSDVQSSLIWMLPIV
jgi:hypothetical protein